MRKKELKIVVTFHTTADAMAMEKICKEKGIPGRLMADPGSPDSVRRVWAGVGRTA